jgi:hypothetical protein
MAGHDGEWQDMTPSDLGMADNDAVQATIRDEEVPTRPTLCSCLLTLLPTSRRRVRRVRRGSHTTPH